MYFKNRANPKSEITKKHQIPSSKKQKATNSKFQTNQFWNLEFVYWNLIGIWIFFWNLEFFKTSLVSLNL
jgi:hypothetical protein